MILVLSLVVLIAGIVAVTSNADTFSPAKFFLIFYVLFHIGAVVEPPRTEVLLLAGIPLFLILIFCFAEGARTQYLPKPSQMVRPAPDGGRDYSVPIIIWAVSAPSVFAQFYMIAEMGGIEGYVQSINTRVVDWSGFGWARVLINLISTLSVAMFAIGLTKRRDKIWWSMFVLHLAFVLFTGLLSGSRSGLLNVLALMACVYHYVRRPISVPVAATFVVSLVGIASLFGVARNGFKLQNGELSTGFQSTSESFSFNSFFYGIDPLELIVSMPQLVLAKGTTFLSLLTNAIPRAIYPEKPDTGGVFFTKNYAGDAWEGFSNLTPTFLGEWIINFGFFAGILGFFLSYGSIMLLTMRRYVALLRNADRKRDETFGVDVAIYIHILWVSVALMIGEITNVVLGLVLNVLVPLAVVRWWIARRAILSRTAGGPVPALG